MTKEQKKYLRELSDLKNFLRYNPILPMDKLLRPEKDRRPDFRFEIDGKIIGIEHIELKSEGNSQKDSFINEIIAEAKKKYKNKNTSEVSVKIIFNHTDIITNKNKDAIINFISDTVENNLTSLEEGLPSKRLPDGRMDSLISAIYAFKIPACLQDKNKDIWKSVDANLVLRDDDLRLPHVIKRLEDCIKSKEDKYEHYIKTCAEVYLLIVHSKGSSDWFDFGTNTLNHKFKSKFKRIFLFHGFDMKSIELQLSN